MSLHFFLYVHTLETCFYGYWLDPHKKATKKSPDPSCHGSLMLAGDTFGPVGSVVVL